MTNIEGGRTRWRPLTCACQINYRWRVLMPGADPVIDEPRFELACEEHSNVPGREQRFAAVLAHHREKQAANDAA